MVAFARWLLFAYMASLPGVRDACAHGPGQKLELTTSWCEHTSGSVHLISGVQIGKDHPVCLTIQNAEQFAISVTLSLVPGTIDDRGRKLCLVPTTPSRGSAWLAEGGADGQFRVTVPGHETRQHTVALHIATFADYPQSNMGGQAFRGWFGCLLVNGQVATEQPLSGHKNARTLHMLQAME